MEVVYSPREQPRPASASPWANYQPSAPAPAAGPASPRPVWAVGPGRQLAPEYPWQQPTGPLVPDPGIRHSVAQQYAHAHDQIRAAQRATAEQAATAAVAKYAAGPHQKEAAIRSAMRSITPWAPYGHGLGEKLGAMLAAQGPAGAEMMRQLMPQPQGQQRGQGQQQQGPQGQPGGQQQDGQQQQQGQGQQQQQGPQGQPDGQQQDGQQQQQGPEGQQQQGQQGGAYGALYYPNPAAAEAFGKAAARVARAGTDQVDSPNAWSAVPHATGRELWAADIILPPRYCTGCRGNHEPSKERDPTWEPYSPETRLTNLRMLVTRFQLAMMRKLSSGLPSLCARFEPGSVVRPIRWLWTRPDGEGGDIEVTPDTMTEKEFVSQLLLMFDGLREGHEPYRHLATLTATAFLDTMSPFIVKATPQLVKPLRLGLQTYEPHLVGHTLYMLQKLLKSHPGVGPALRPHLPHLLPYLGLFRPSHFKVHLPPPFCVPSTGCFSGKGKLPGSPKTSCPVCGAPTDKLQYDNRKSVAKERLQAASAANAHFYAPEPEETPRLVKGRRSKKYLLTEVIDETLELLVRVGGPGTIKVIQRQVPRFCYLEPRD